MMLGDLGASVIKVERPSRGDDTRGWGPPFDDDGQSAYYLSVNRNKLSLTLDFDVSADAELLCELIRDADVVLDNFIPGVLERHGVVPARLLTENPRLIWCTITGFGPESARPGYDFVIQAESGWMSITGEPGGPPLKTGVALADLIAGKDAAVAVLAALVRRERSTVVTEARRIWISLAQSATASLVNVAQNALVSGTESRRWGNAHPNLVPYQTFEASDRTVVIAVGSDAQWNSLAAVLGLNDLARDPELATNSGRLKNREFLVRRIQESVGRESAAHWIKMLETEGIPCGVVRSVLEALGDVNASAATGVAPAIPGTIRLLPPKLNEHGDSIRQLGWKIFDTM
jgi:crotonobetainyl-CoA:carnitine CoA-transferase CaiB-like acyl-CoA transferase